MIESVLLAAADEETDGSSLPEQVDDLFEISRELQYEKIVKCIVDITNYNALARCHAFYIHPHLQFHLYVDFCIIGGHTKIYHYRTAYCIFIKFARFFDLFGFPLLF